MRTTRTLGVGPESSAGLRILDVLKHLAVDTNMHLEGVGLRRVRFGRTWKLCFRVSREDTVGGLQNKTRKLLGREGQIRVFKVLLVDRKVNSVPAYSSFGAAYLMHGMKT